MRHLGHHVAVYGMTAHGKSHLVKQKLAGLPRVLALDVNDEYSQHGRRAGPLHERCTASELSLNGNLLLKPHLSLAVVPDKPSPESRARALKMIWSMLEGLAEKRQAQPLVLVLDELGEYVEHCLAVAKSLASRGLTHLSCSLIVITQRPFIVPKTVRSQMAEIFVFRLEEVDDADAATERFKPDPKLSSTEAQALPPRKFLVKRPTNLSASTTEQSQSNVEAQS